MADAEFKFESAQWDKVLKKLRSKWDDIRSRKEFGGIVSIAAFKDIMEHFENEQGPDGSWEKRSQPYKTWIEKQGYTKILQVTGKLRGSLTPEKGKFRANSSGILLYSNLEYADRHDSGKNGMPKRKFMWISKGAIDSIIKQTERWLSEGI